MSQCLQRTITDRNNLIVSADPEVLPTLQMVSYSPLCDEW